MARTRANDFAAKQSGILDSAAAVFAEQGMDKASMAQIASHSGVSKALLYHYYPSKDALIFAIIQSHLSNLDIAITAADRPDLAPPARLEALVAAVLDTYKGADNHHKVQLNAAPLLNDSQRAALRNLERRIVAHFSTLLRQINPALSESALLMPVTMSLFGMMNWVYTWFREDGPITRDAYAKLATQILLNGIANPP